MKKLISLVTILLVSGIIIFAQPGNDWKLVQTSGEWSEAEKIKRESTVLGLAVLDENTFCVAYRTGHLFIYLYSKETNTSILRRVVALKSIPNLNPTSDLGNGIAISPDGKFVATGSWTTLDDTKKQGSSTKNVVYVFKMEDLKSENTIQEIQSITPNKTFSYDGILPVTQLEFSSDGSKLLANVAGVVYITDFNTEKIVNTVEYSKSFASTFYGDDNTVAISDANEINIYSISKKSFIKSLKGHKDDIVSLFCLKEKSLLISGDFKNNLIMWDINSGKQSGKTIKCKFIPAIVKYDSKENTLIISVTSGMYYYNLDTKKLTVRSKDDAGNKIDRPYKFDLNQSSTLFILNRYGTDILVYER